MAERSRLKHPGVRLVNWHDTRVWENYPALGAKRSSIWQTNNVSKFLVIVKQFPWEARNDMLDEVTLYPTSWAQRSDGWAGVGPS